MHPSFRRVALATQRALQGFDPLADAGEGSFAAPGSRPIFLVGAPRCGSTLLLQLMIRHFEVAYVSNLMALAPLRMLRIAQLTRARMRRPRPLREAELGYVSGLFGPNEAGALMRAWFGGELAAGERQRIRATVGVLGELLGGPLVAKNLWNSLRLERISGVFPEAAFVHLRRNPLYTAQSLLRARRRQLGDAGRWLGPEPEGHVAVLAERPAYQVLWQVKAIDDAVTGFLRNRAVEHRVVCYEDLCADAEAELQGIAEGLGLSWRPAERVTPLSQRDSVLIPPEEWQELRTHHAALFG